MRTWTRREFGGLVAAGFAAAAVPVAAGRPVVRAVWHPWASHPLLGGVSMAAYRVPLPNGDALASAVVVATPEQLADAAVAAGKIQNAGASLRAYLDERGYDVVFEDSPRPHA